MTEEAWLTGRRGQGLAAGLGILGLAVAWCGIVQPLEAWFSDRSARLEQRRDLLSHMRGLAASLPALRAAAVDRHGEDRSGTTMMLPGDTDAVAAADLQERVQKMASDAGANLAAVETLPPVPAGKTSHKVALRISLTASWPVLLALVHAIEQSPTRILIDDVQFRGPPLTAHATILPIQASMVLYGFRSADTDTGT